MAQLPELGDSRLRQYGNELQVRDDKENKMREFCLQWSFRRQIGGVGLDGEVDKAKSLLVGVVEVFATFKKRLHFLNEKIRVIAKAIRQMKATKRDRMARMYCAWLEHEERVRDEIFQANSWRPPGEVKMLVVGVIPESDAAVRQVVLGKFYREERMKFHREFLAWHRERKRLENTVKDMKKTAFLQKVERDNHRKARHELFLTPISPRVDAFVSELELATNNLTEHLRSAPSFLIAPSPAAISRLMEIARGVAPSPPTPNRRLSRVASISRPPSRKASVNRLPPIDRQPSLSKARRRSSAHGGVKLAPLQRKK